MSPNALHCSYRTTWLSQRPGLRQLSQVFDILEGAGVRAIHQIPAVPVLSGHAAVRALSPRNGHVAVRQVHRRPGGAAVAALHATAPAAAVGLQSVGRQCTGGPKSGGSRRRCGPAAGQSDRLERAQPVGAVQRAHRAKRIVQSDERFGRAEAKACTHSITDVRVCACSAFGGASIRPIAPV